jgi:sirohydrochlorin cobaltochelatase
MRNALVLVAHGSRDPEWMRPLRAIAERIGQLRPDLEVSLAFLELSPPPPEESVRAAAEGGAASVFLAPLFLGQGAHARGDMAALAARLKSDHPRLRIELLPSLGEFEVVLDAAAAALAAAAR